MRWEATGNSGLYEGELPVGWIIVDTVVPQLPKVPEMESLQG